MATTTTFTVTLTNVNPKALAAILTLAAKHEGVTCTPVANVAPKVSKVFDATTCESIPMGKLSEALDGVRGPGMLQRVAAMFSIDYGMASTLVSAESAARKDKRDTMFVVPAKAPAIRAIIESL